jgi:hypothetical protein
MSTLMTSVLYQIIFWGLLITRLALNFDDLMHLQCVVMPLATAWELFLPFFS